MMIKFFAKIIIQIVILPKYVQNLIKINTSKFFHFDWRAFNFGAYKENPCILIYLKNKIIYNIDKYKFMKLGSCFSQNPDQLLIIAGIANQIYQWDKNHMYCGRCGKKFQFSIEELSKKCMNCENILYPQISPAIIVLIQKGNKLLLANNTRNNNKRYRLISGFVNIGETLEECIIREVKEEVGLVVDNIRYMRSQPWPFPNSLMLGFRADWKKGEIKCDGKEINNAR